MLVLERPTPGKSSEKPRSFNLDDLISTALNDAVDGAHSAALALGSYQQNPNNSSRV